MRAWRDEEASGAWLRVVLLALAVLFLLVLPVSSPGSGTAVNLDSSGDAGALIRADHHAKTLPSVAAVAIVLAVVAIAARLVQRTTTSVAVRVGAVLDRLGAVERCVDTGVLARATWARRGPPAVV
jgi:hypothetical protein